MLALRRLYSLNRRCRFLSIMQSDLNAGGIQQRDLCPNKLTIKNAILGKPEKKRSMDPVFVPWFTEQKQAKSPLARKGVPTSYYKALFKESPHWQNS